MFSDTHNGDQRGTSYIRWGRKTCENNATLVYKGVSAAYMSLQEYIIRRSGNDDIEK